MKQYVVENLGATERAWDYMLSTQDGAKKLIDSFWRNDPSVMGDNIVPILCFSATTLELSAARLMHGGKLSGDAPIESSQQPPPAAVTPSEEVAASSVADAELAADGDAPSADTAGTASQSPSAEDEAPASAVSDTQAEGDGEKMFGGAVKRAAPPPAEVKVVEIVKPHQDPAELLMITVCTPLELSPSACISRMVYISSLAEESGEALGGKGAISGASSLDGVVSCGVVASGSMVMLEQVRRPLLTFAPSHRCTISLRTSLYVLLTFALPLCSFAHFTSADCARGVLANGAGGLGSSLQRAWRQGYRGNARRDGIRWEHAEIWFAAPTRHSSDDWRRQTRHSVYDHRGDRS